MCATDTPPSSTTREREIAHRKRFTSVRPSPFRRSIRFASENRRCRGAYTSVVYCVPKRTPKREKRTMAGSNDNELCLIPTGKFSTIAVGVGARNPVVGVASSPCTCIFFFFVWLFSCLLLASLAILYIIM